jgi:hypothetical protein
MDEELVDIHKVEILSIINDLINLKDFEKSQKNIIEFSNTFLKDIVKIEKSKMKPLVKLENTGNKELEDKMNGILEVFHEITKTHDNNLNRNGQTALEVRDITNKEFAILNLIYKKIGQEEFNKLGVSWNPYIGLFIPSKEGFDKEKQVLMMSHLDLVPTFERAHEKVEKGELASALTIMDDKEINENTIIAGSLDNTMTNAVLLKNILNNRFDNNDICREIGDYILEIRMHDRNFPDNNRLITVRFAIIPNSIPIGDKEIVIKELKEKYDFKETEKIDFI